MVRDDNMEIITSLVRFYDFLSCISYLIQLKLINIRTIVVFKGVYGKYCSNFRYDICYVIYIKIGPFFMINFWFLAEGIDLQMHLVYLSKTCLWFCQLLFFTNLGHISRSFVSIHNLFGIIRPKVCYYL